MVDVSRDPVSWLIAHEQIRQLAARYAVLLDARDLDGLVQLFVDDVNVGDRTGRVALKENFTDQLGPLGVTVLHVGGHVIDLVSDDFATGIVTCAADIERDQGRVIQAIQYHDTYARRENVWYFVRRRHLLVYDGSIRGPLPSTLETWKRFTAEQTTRATFNEGKLK